MSGMRAQTIVTGDFESKRRSHVFRLPHNSRWRTFRHRVHRVRFVLPTREIQLLECSNCQQPCRASECYQNGNNDGPILCLNCAPRHAPLLCTICKELRHPGAFAARYRQNTSDDLKVRRCKSCGEKCSRCEKYMPNDRYFATGSSLCWQCDREQHMLTCERCDVRKRRNCYDGDVVHNHTAHKTKLVCLDCYKLGYSCDTQHGTKTFRCAAGHDCGHLAFDPTLLDNCLSRNTSALRFICEECKKKPKFRCSIHRTNHEQPELYEWYFSEHDIKKKKGKCRMVCHACCELGYSTSRGGDQSHRCDFCWQDFGHKKFDARALSHQKSQNSKLACQGCKSDRSKNTSI